MWSDFSLNNNSQGGKNVKTFRWDHRLQKIQNLFMAFKRVPQMEITLGQQYNVGEKPTIILYTLTSIAMQGHEKNKTEAM